PRRDRRRTPCRAGGRGNRCTWVFLGREPARLRGARLRERLGDLVGVLAPERAGARLLEGGLGPPAADVAEELDGERPAAEAPPAQRVGQHLAGARDVL